MSNRLSTKLMLIGMRDSIKKALDRGEKPLHDIKMYHEKLSKYKRDFKDEHDKEIKNIAKEFNGEIVN